MADYTFGEELVGELESLEKTWRIDFVLPDGDGPAEAHTHGLDRFGHQELQIRNVPPEIAGHILNTLGSWIATGRGRLESGDKILIGGIPHTIVSATDQSDMPVLRLAWRKDPPASEPLGNGGKQ